MRRLTRLIAALMAVLLLQLVLVGGGYACAVTAPGATTAPGTADRTSMAGMAMGGAGTSATAASRGATDPHSDCQFPWMPDGCQGMAPCAPSIVLVAAAQTKRVERVHAAPAAVDVPVPASFQTVPELPPPRA